MRYLEKLKAKDAPSGHIALITVLAAGPRRLAVANTHLKWDPPGTPAAAQWGLRQIGELLDRRPALAPEAEAWIVTGDLNVGPESDVVAALAAAGFRDAHAGEAPFATCVTSGHAHRVDWLFAAGNLGAHPRRPPPLDDTTALPSAEEPSDHLPLEARFAWAEP